MADPQSPLAGSQPEPAAQPEPADPSVTRFRVRSGFKREFEFAMRSQSQLGAYTGRTRARARRNEAALAASTSQPRRQLHAGPSSMDEVESANDLSGKRVFAEDGELSEFVEMPSVEKLLGTGLLDGKWVHCAAAAGEDNEQILRGLIKDGSIFCHCDSCKGATTVLPEEFEHHAGITEGHPAKCIQFENGKTVQDVLQACKETPVNMLESAIKKVIRSNPKRKSYSSCKNCRAPFRTSSRGKFKLLCDPCRELKQQQPIPSATNGPASSAGLSNSISEKTSLSLNKKVTSGKVTKKDVGFHKLFMNKALFGKVNLTVTYVVNKKKVLEGEVRDTGILCFHCDKVVSPSRFEAHAGHGQKRKPYDNIYFEGRSLHELSVILSDKGLLPDRKSDNLCSVCRDGGQLLGCSICPRAFHIGCVRLSSFPEEKWRCRYCQRNQRKTKLNQNGRVARDDHVEQILGLLRTPVIDADGCVFCRQKDYTLSEFGPRTVMICDQCEKQHHVECLKEHSRDDLKALPEAEWFCSTDCSRIYAALQELVHKGAQSLPVHNANLIKRKFEAEGLCSEAVDFRWRLLTGKTLDDVSKSLLSEAAAIFCETFNFARNRVKQKELISTMVNGGKLSDEQDYTGMYCAVLTVCSSTQSTGIVRVLGSDAAELPLVATRKDSQNLGYFGALLSCIESFLASINVKHLVLPTTHETESKWINKFGFSRASQYELHNCLRGARLTKFRGASMLWKPITSGR